MSLLKRLWEGWKRFAHKVGEFNTRVVLFVFYWLGLGLTAIVVRPFLRDMLDRKIKPGSLYRTLEPRATNMANAKRQF